MRSNPMEARGKFVAGACLLIGLTLLAYGPAFQAGFVWDDNAYVQDNLTLRSGEGLRRIWFDVRATPQYYPLVHTSFWMEYHLWGLNPMGYHVVNVLGHAISAVLLWRVLGVLGVSGSWIAAAVFAVHPVHVESVAWITERKNVLSALFYLAAALAYLRGPGGWRSESPTWRAGWWYAASLGLFLCALLSKTVACSLPAALLLVIWWKQSRIGWREVLPLAPFFVLGAALGLLTAYLEKEHVHASGAEWDLSFVERCLIAGRAVWFYAGKLVWPTPLAFFYPRWNIDAGVWWQFLFPAAALAVVAALWLGRGRIGRGPLVAVLFFGGTLVPALGFFDVYPMRFSFVADHFQYMASWGLIALAAAAGYRGAHRLGGWAIPGATIACAVVLTMLGALTWRQARQFENLETLWRSTIEKNPDAWPAMNNLGSLAQDKGHLDEAIAHFRRALEANPDFYESHYNLATIFASRDQMEKAVAHYREAVRLKPDWEIALNHLAWILATDDDPRIRNGPEAVRLAERAAQLVGGPHPPFLRTLAAAYAEVGQNDLAIAHCSQSIDLAPRVAGTYNMRATLYGKLGRLDLALKDYDRAIELKPDVAEFYHHRGNVYAQAGQNELAVADFTRAIERNPDFVDAYYSLGNLYLRAARDDLAGREYTRVIELKSDHADAYRNRAISSLGMKKYDEAWADVRMVRKLGHQVHPQFLQKLTEDSGRSE